MNKYLIIIFRPSFIEIHGAQLIALLGKPRSSI
jgi:hypothetical protein